MSQKTEVKKGLDGKSITISREFNAPIELVWRAYTEKELLAQWWSPAPWKLETKTMNFKEGGFWHYAMVSPENEKHWARMNYIKINKLEKFDKKDFFCDESGVVNEYFPPSDGTVVFTKTSTGTNVDYILKFATEDGLNQVIQMGFEQGMTMCLEQLETLLPKLKGEYI